MNKELKIQLENIEEAEQEILKAGAKFINATTSTYTYFNQPAGMVLKITKNDKGFFKVRIQRDDKQFKILGSERLADPQSSLAQLSQKYGIKKKLTNKRRVFKYQGFNVSINQIQDVGNFLVVEGKEPTFKIIEELGFKNPEIVTESFDNI